MSDNLDTKETIDYRERWFGILLRRWEEQNIVPTITEFYDVSDIEEFNIYLFRLRGKRINANIYPNTT